MNKTLALIALLGLVSAPAFANEAAAPAAPAKAEKVVAKDGDKKEEAKKEGEAKAEDAAKAAAPAEKK